MGQKRHAAVGLLLLSAVFGCASQKGNKEPNSAASPAEQSEGAELKEDAVAATVKLAGLWVLPVVNDPEKATGWHRHEASGTCTPTGSTSWALNHEKTYAPNDESVTVWNEKLGVLMTLYTYPAANDVETEFESVANTVTGTCTENPVVSTTIGETHYVGCVNRLENGVLLLEQVQVTRHDQWFNKVRITFPAATAEQAHGPAMAFAGQSFKACPNAP